MSRLSTLALPLAIAITAFATAGSGVAVAVDRRGDPDRSADQTTARVAAASAQEKEYREALRPIVEDVYDQVGALSEAIAAADVVDSKASALALLDSVRDPRASASLAASRDSLLLLQPPAFLTKTQDRLAVAVTDYGQAVRELRVASPPDQPDADGFGAAAERLDDATRRWRADVAKAFGAEARPALPADPDGAGARVRAPVSPVAYLFGVGQVCAREVDRNEKRIAEVGRRAEDLAAMLRRTIGGVREVKAPPQDRDRLGREVVAPLTKLLEVTDALDTLAAAGEGDQTAAAKALPLLRQSVPTFRLVEKGFTAYGSQVCAATFRPAG